MRILILTSCTGEKHVSCENQLTLEDFRAGGEHLKAREKELAEHLAPAGLLYSGQQHVRLMRGVDAVRGQKDSGITIDLKVLSAGYGIVDEGKKIAPYEATFTGMKSKEVRDWGQQLGVPEDFSKLMAGSYDFVLVLLGDLYLGACNVTDKTIFASPTVLFCGTATAKKLPTLENLKIVPISNPEAKRFSCGLVALKGELAHRICSGLVGGTLTSKKLTEPKEDVLALLDVREVSEPQNKATSKKKAATKKEGAKKPPMVPNPKVDKVIQIPKSWWDKPHRKKLRYFIPEWDDLVDPDYDFLTDTHSGGRSNWENEVYAHQMYPEPNYDGLLMSRAVAEKSKAKKARINEVGVHRMLRVPREFPVMGDCGAFDYIMEDVPPYSTEDVLDYYTRLDFDYGVSVDHLIVSGTEHQKKERYELTIQNAEDFLKEHRKAGLKWEPMGAVQGWDPKSYAKAAAKYVKMGYKYIALGGLVRSSTPNILKALHEVHKVVPDNIPIHLFGLARFRVLREFADYGVRSVDSASYLRQAWMRDSQGYLAVDRSYAAIRVPEVGKSFRSKGL
ncbi:MAG: tRNA-guanine transglycosylase DpdA [Verrucomicrobiales bacterium]